MATQPPDSRKQAAARQGSTWTEEEKTRGAGAAADHAGVAGEAEAKGNPKDEREQTEAAAAKIQDAAPDPDAPVGGGRGTRSTGGSATDPGTGPKGPRNPA